MPRKTKIVVIQREDIPCIENEPSLEDWLASHKARLLWQHDGPVRRGIPTYRIAGYQIGTRTAIVVIRAESMGWDVFTSSSSTEIDRVLGDAESRLGL
jgi:hypothetical protein